MSDPLDRERALLMLAAKTLDLIFNGVQSPRTIGFVLLAYPNPDFGFDGKSNVVTSSTDMEIVRTILQTHLDKIDDETGVEVIS